MPDFGSFYDDIVKNENTKDRYFTEDINGVGLDIPRNAIRHDANKHGLTKEEWQGIFDAVRNGGIKEARMGDYSKMHGVPVKMVVDVNGVEYGVTFEHMRNGRNLIQSAFVLDDKGWINEKQKKKSSQAEASEPLPKSRRLGNSMFNIISSLDGNVNNRGTFDPNNDNIYYQERIADRVKEIFQPAFSDVEKFAETLKKAIRGELKPQTMLQVSSSTPEVYKSLGVEDKALNLPQNVLRKINIGKHNVPLSVIENLPEFIANPLVVLDSKTEAGSFVSVLDATDANGDTVVAVIKPTDRNYNVIPSVYGKKEIENLIKSSNVRYVNDIEKPATASIDLSSLQLRGGDSARGNSNNILQKSDIVNILNQNTTNPKGSYNPNTGVIKIFETADFSTLPHELAHYWLDNMWNYTRSGNASEQYKQRWNVIANWLNVRPEQTRLTRGQQEKFARGYEQYLREGKAPNNYLKQAFRSFWNWLRHLYRTAAELNADINDGICSVYDEIIGGKDFIPIYFIGAALVFWPASIVSDF